MIPVMGYNTINEIPLQILLSEVLERKKAGMRLSQACASYLDENFELSYSFADDENLNYETLRVIVGLNEPVPTISDMFPYAAFYENEMRELFGVNIMLIDPDYHDKFYRIKAQTPFLPEDAQKKKAQEMLSAAAQSKEAAPSKEVDPSKATAPSKEVDPSKAAAPSKEVDPSKAAASSKAVDPSKAAAPSKTVGQSKSAVQSGEAE